MRPFQKLDPAVRTLILWDAIGYALRAANEPYRRRTDVLGLATKYASVNGAKREDFSELLQKPMRLIVQEADARLLRFRPKSK